MSTSVASAAPAHTRYCRNFSTARGKCMRFDQKLPCFISLCNIVLPPPPGAVVDIAIDLTAALARRECSRSTTPEHHPQITPGQPFPAFLLATKMPPARTRWARKPQAFALAFWPGAESVGGWRGAVWRHPHELTPSVVMRHNRPMTDNMHPLSAWEANGTAGLMMASRVVMRCRMCR